MSVGDAFNCVGCFAFIHIGLLDGGLRQVWRPPPVGCWLENRKTAVSRKYETAGCLNRVENCFLHLLTSLRTQERSKDPLSYKIAIHLLVGER